MCQLIDIIIELSFAVFQDSITMVKSDDKIFLFRFLQQDESIYFLFHCVAKLDVIGYFMPFLSEIYKHAWANRLSFFQVK